MTAFLVNYEIDNKIALLPPCKVLLVSIEQGIVDITHLSDYQTAYVVFLYHGNPLGVSILPVKGDSCLAVDLYPALAKHQRRLNQVRFRARLERPISADGLTQHEVDSVDPVANHLSPEKSCTIVIPTRDRPVELARCLKQLAAEVSDNIQVIVVDSASMQCSVADIVKEHLPEAQVCRVDQPGASCARNEGITHARNEIVVFLDDDVTLIPGCLEVLKGTFDLHPCVDVVTGLVLPDDMAELAQARFEASAGFGRGFERRWISRSSVIHNQDPKHLDLVQLGVGACFAVRKTAFVACGGFNTKYGPGISYSSAEDVDLFFRLVEAGGILIYEPRAMSKHLHRTEQTKVEAQLLSVGQSVASVYRDMSRYPGAPAKLAGRWFRQYLKLGIQKALRATLRPDHYSPGLYWRQVWEMVLTYYVLAPFNPRSGVTDFTPSAAVLPAAKPAGNSHENGLFSFDSRVKIRRIDLGREVLDFSSGERLAGVEFHLFSGMVFRGRFRLPLVSGLIPRDQILDAAVYLYTRLVKEQSFERSSIPDHGDVTDQNHTKEYTSQFSFRPAVSVVIPTRDRPDELQHCLAAVARQEYDGEFEVLVVDNNPDSGLTQPVVDRFPFCRYLVCHKPGASATRNTGFREASGEIVAVTDDDVRVPPTWIKQLVAPFWRSDVWMVTGTILPRSLETQAERLFEAFGGFGLVEKVTEASADWFRLGGSLAPPVWHLGTTANMAFRRRIVEDETIGPLREHLGPGTAAGAGEDLYFVYRLLKEGHTVLLDPGIWVSHCHRERLPTLRRQVFAYGKSAVAYHLEILIRDKDLRGARMLFFDMPLYQLKRFLGFKYRTPLLYWPEVAGQTLGGWYYIRSRLNDRRYHRQLKQPGSGSK